MKKLAAYWLIIVMLLFAIATSLAVAGSPPSVGGPLLEIKLPIPKDSAEKKYLDLGFFGFGTFKIPEIKAKLVVIEIFSMYCPYCQREAPNVNELFAKIDGNPSLKGKIKIIGIGAGNTSYEVGTFKNKYNVPFPLFADGDYVIHKMVGEVRTPYFIAVKIDPDGTNRVVYSRLGTIGGVDEFLSTLIRLSELQ